MFPQNPHLNKLKKGIRQNIKDLHVTGLSGAARAFFISDLITETDRPCLVVLPSAREAKRFYKEAVFFLPESLAAGGPGQRRLYDYPVYDISPLAGLSPHPDVVTRRLQALYGLISESRPVVITSTEALLTRTLPKSSFVHALEYLEAGEEVDRDALIRRLQDRGYLRTSLVEERGDYSVRGGVVDLFPPLYSEPLRLEFFGDVLESIRHFDPVSQRSTGHVKELILLPTAEILRDRRNVERARSKGRLPGDIREGGGFPGQEAWLNHFYENLSHLFDYLPENGLLLLVDPERIAAEQDRFEERFQRDVEKYRLEAEESEKPFPKMEGILVSPGRLRASIESFQRVRFSELNIGVQRETEESVFITGASDIEDNLDIRLAGKGKVSLAPLADRIARWKAEGSRVVLVCRTEQQARRLEEILNNYQVEVDGLARNWSEVPLGKGAGICLGRLSRGFSWPELGLVLISEDEIFGRKKAGAKVKPRMEEKGLGSAAFSQLQEGDLVVHQDHGIGRYSGLCKLEIEQKVNEFVIVDYANNDRLYVPADRISILQKYVGADENNPRLDQMGGRSWDVVKQKAKQAVKKIAKQLVEIYALRKYREGFAFSRPDHYYREFEATFEHEETPDQIKVIEDVLSDMESDRPMDRLICGDVGFGKTEVAIRASFKAAMDGKQVAVLVPTTVLAEQHYETFKKRMDPFGVRVEVLSRFKSRAEQKEILARLRSGKIDIIIGTHRLLQRDLSFRELGLLVIDEEQRFGVRQKETIKRYRALVDVLALTATPIPRTLQMSLLGVRDLSIIETPPEDRQAIQTFISPFDEAAVVHAIEFELERGGQVFFVHNRVRTIDHMAERLRTLVPQARLATAHGQMREHDLEETMLRFLRREIDVLVCTTIIESGLDIPSTNTIIIDEADRFGLAQIYQLRGRVGRSDETAYAYLLLSDETQMTREARKRLKALMDFSNLGAGLHLAMHDLKIRGGGNILGFTQSGHISAVGYELYLRFIEQAIAELKGEEWHEEINPEINVNLPAYLPESYIADTDLRLHLYRRMSSLREEDELKSLVEEMDDRFGPPPVEVSNLFAVMSVRLILKRWMVVRLDVGDGALVLTFSPTRSSDPGPLINVAAREPARYRFLSENRLRVRTGRGAPLESLLKAERLFRRLEEIRDKEGSRNQGLRYKAAR